MTQYERCCRISQNLISSKLKSNKFDVGINNQKTPTVLLLTPEGEFHSFGFTARDFYHDLQTREARRWLYFDRFKMILHHNKVRTKTLKFSRPFYPMII